MPSPLHPTRTYDRAQGPSQIIVVTLPPQVFTQSLTATLSFSGAFTKGLLYVRSFTATLFGGGGTSSTIDSYSETNRSEDQQVAGGGGANNLAIGQCFTGSGLTLGSCKFYVKKTGSPTGNATAKIFATLVNTFGTDACPSGSPPTVAATSDNLDVSTISTTQALVTLTFSGANQIALTTGTHYGISFEFSGGDGSNYILIADDATSPTHSGNAFFKDGGTTPGYSGGGFGAADVCFYVYSTGGGAGPSVTFARKPLKTLAATFSPVTALAKKIIDSGFVATLSFVGATTKKIIDAGFTATRSFVGNLAASKTFVRAFTATANFAAAITRKIIDSGFAATFAPVATLTKRITHAAFSATLTFVGVITRNVRKNLSAAQSWIGNLATSFIAGGGHVFTQTYDATMSFVGLIAKLPRKVFTPTLAPSGAITRRTSHLLTATLSFPAGITKAIRDAGFAATQSFSGFLATSKSFIKSLTATLSFSGILRPRVSKAFAATLSFLGAQSRNIRRNLAATLLWIGNLVTQYIPPGVQTYYKDLTATLASSAALTKKNIDAGFSAVLSFVGNLAQVKLFLRLFTATLSSTATLARSTRKASAATLSTATSLIKRITRTFSATLAFAGLMVKAVRDAGFTATLSFAGNLATATHHFFVRGFTATLSFVGNLSRTKTIVKLLTATLAFTGSLRRAISKSLAATLNFSTALRRTIRKGLAAILSFVGFVFRGLPSIIRAGQVAGATLIIAVASGFIRVLRTASFIKIATKDVAGSTIRIQKAGSQLRVERTE